jgi:hypothetical protein
MCGYELGKHETIKDMLYSVPLDILIRNNGLVETLPVHGSVGDLV